VVERIIRAASAAPGLTALLVLAGAGLGAVWLQDLPRDVFPDLSAPVFNVIVQNAALGPEELEVGISIPLEAALAGLPEVRRIRSTSQLGYTQVTLQFEADADYFRSRQLVAERVAQVAGQLPAGTEPPLISSLSGRINEIFEFTLEAEPGAADLMTLRDLAEFDVRNRLLAVPGVAAVDILGGYLRQFQVQLDPDRMWARGITLDEVLHATEGANVNAAGGVVVDGPIEWTVRAVGRVTAIDELRNTVVAVRSGTPVLLGDVADVREAPAVRRGLAHRLQGEVVSCRVIKQFGADTVRVAAGVRAAIADIQRSLPPGVRGHIVYDQSELIESALGGVGRAVLLGAVFVVLVIFGLLGNLRAALIVIATIPLSIALSGLVLRPAGVGLNTMTLGGLAIAVGILVDAAIIVTENAWHRISTAGGAGSRRAAALAAATEVGRPIAFATLIVMAVFVPLFGMTGIEGRMYKPLAAAVIAAVGAALVLALTLVPLVAGLVLRPRPPGKPEDVRPIRWLKRVYAPLLDACMRHAAWVRLGSLAITIPAVVLALRVGSDFMPKLDEGAFMVVTYLPPEASLEEVDRLNHRLEDLLREVPEVEDVLRRTGRGERTEDPMPHTMSDVLVILRPQRARPLAAIARDVHARLAAAPGLSGVVGTPLTERIDEAIGGTPADLVVSIFGPDLDQLAALAERARALVGQVDGIADLRAEALTGLPQLRVVIDRAAVARVGLTPGDVVHALRVGLAGEEQSQVWIGQRHYELVVRLQDHRRGDVNAIRTLLVDAYDGLRIPLGQLATIEQTFGPAAIRREAGSRRIAVEATVFGRDLGSTAAAVQERLARDLTLPPGYFVTVGGRVESQAHAARALLIAIGAALVVVFVLLHLAVGSAAEALIVLATLPDAFVGGIAALLIAGETWNVSSLVGLIALFGIAVQNGLVLITQTKGLVAEGRPFTAALREASIGRVRPKVLTAATAILGLMPLLVLRLHGTEIERPLAVVMIGGLVTSTLFTLLALPTFYVLVHQLQTRLMRES
jgi:cobalt-zinc-cadmium resistance protein CzcA